MAVINVLDRKAGRLATFGLLYISEGIPLGFAVVAMSAYMRRQGLDVAQIGVFVASFYLPWAFKWAWAPIVDLVTLKRFGGRKAWIVLCQALMIASLYVIAQIDHESYFDLLVTLVIVHNVFAATNDIAIDSLAVNALREDERGQGNGFMFGGAYLGQGLGGGGAMFVSEHFGFGVSFLYAALLMTAVLFFTLFFVRDPTLPGVVADRATDVWRKFRDSLLGFLSELRAGFFQSGAGPLVGVVFALMPFGAMALASGVATTLQVDIGMSDGDIATLNIASTILSAFGCIVGGWLADKLGHRRMLAAYYGLTVLPVLFMAVVSSGDSGISAITVPMYFAAALSFSLFMGMHYGTSAAIFMGLTNPAIAATQFTGFMALRNLTISYTNAWQGAAVAEWDYSTMFYIDAALAVIPILLIPFLRERQDRGRLPAAGAPLPEAG